MLKIKHKKDNHIFFDTLKMTNKIENIIYQIMDNK